MQITEECCKITSRYLDPWIHTALSKLNNQRRGIPLEQIFNKTD